MFLLKGCFKLYSLYTNCKALIYCTPLCASLALISLAHTSAALRGQKHKPTQLALITLRQSTPCFAGIRMLRCVTRTLRMSPPLMSLSSVAQLSEGHSGTRKAGHFKNSLLLGTKH